MCLRDGLERKFTRCYDMLGASDVYMPTDMLKFVFDRNNVYRHEKQPIALSETSSADLWGSAIPSP